MKIWPFYLIAEAKEKKRLAKYEADMKEIKVRVDKNTPIFKALAKEFIENQIALYKANYPQPFQVGQFVDILFYGCFHSKNWLPAGSALCSHFGDVVPELKGPATLKVKACYVDDSWLTDVLDCQFNDKCKDIVYWSKDEAEVKDRFKKYVEKLNDNKHSTNVDWCITVDWDYHKFPYKGEYLKLPAWNMYANTFIDSTHPVAIAQKLVHIKHEGVKQAKEFYDKEYEKLELEIQKFKGQLRLKEYKENA